MKDMEGTARRFSAYYQYLEDIRRRLFSLVIVFVLAFFLGFFNSGAVLQFIVHLFQIEHATLVTTSPFQFFDLAMSVGVYTGFLVSSPLFLYHLYGFLKDGLNRHEKKFFFILLPASLVLFVTGFMYSFAILYFTLNSIAAFNLSLGIENLWDISKFLLQIVLTSVLLGLIFQFPIVLTFLSKLGVISASILRAYRRHAIAAMFILTALLPPTDGLSLVIMVVPLMAIYEMTILVSAFLERKNPVNVIG